MSKTAMIHVTNIFKDRSLKIIIFTFLLVLLPAVPPALAGNRVAAWGAGIITNTADGNDYGQSVIPVTLTNAVLMAGGWRHSLALKADGTLRSWGDNSLGQTAFPTGSNYVSIACGYLHSLALQSNGSVVAWGFDAYGQTDVPSNLSNVVAIASGFYHSLALKADGTVVTWGPSTNIASIGIDPDYGQTLIPSGLSNVVAIAGGGWHSLALKSDGMVTGWGRTDYGQAYIPPGLSNVVVTGFTFLVQSMS